MSYCTSIHSMNMFVCCFFMTDSLISLLLDDLHLNAFNTYHCFHIINELIIFLQVGQTMKRGELAIS